MNIKKYRKYSGPPPSDPIDTQGESNIRKGALKSFNSTDYLATVQMAGSMKAYLEDIPVSRGIPSAQMVAGRYVAVLSFDDTSPGDGVVIAVYT